MTQEQQKLDELDRRLTERDALVGELNIRLHVIERETLTRSEIAALANALDARILALESAATVKKARGRKK